MMSNQEIHIDEGPVDFKGATLQMHDEGFQGGKITTSGLENANNNADGNVINGNAAPGMSSEVAVVPWSGEDARTFFSHRDDIIEKAVKDCTTQVITVEDGDLLGTWLLTEISFWDNEKERLVLLTSNYIITVKYDLIALKMVDVRRVPLEKIDTVVIGDLSYPPNSLIPSRNIRGVRAMWNQGAPLTFTKKWNPFTNDIPWNTYTSHPLLWHKEADDKERSMYNVDDFGYRLVQAVEKSVRSTPCSVQHKPIVLENYVGLSSLIHNKNSLGFFKIRGKFSF